MPSYLDLAVFIVIALSSLLAVLRGFKRTLLAIFAWLASGALAYFFYPLAIPFIRPFVSKTAAASVSALTIAVVFFGALLISSLCTALLSSVLLGSQVSLRDRAAGLVYGSLRGFLLSIIAFGIYAWLVPEPDQPVWVHNAYSRPILQSGSEALLAFMPESVDSVIARLKAKIVVPENQMPPIETKPEAVSPQPAVDGAATVPAPEASPVEMKPRNAPSEPADNISPGAQSPDAQSAVTKPEKAPSVLPPAPPTGTAVPDASKVEVKPENIPSGSAAAVPQGSQPTEVPAAVPMPEKTVPGPTVASPSGPSAEPTPPVNSK
jgi:membrane protein required for colicin V production